MLGAGSSSCIIVFGGFILGGYSMKIKGMVKKKFRADKISTVLLHLKNIKIIFSYPS